jgi:hypothetical protein
MSRLVARVAALEAKVVPPDDGTVEWLKTLSTAELIEVSAAQLIAHGADPETAAEAFENSWRLGSRDRGDSWADLVPLLPEALAAYVADLRKRAELGGVPAEVALRLEEGAFRRRVVTKAGELWPPEGWSYCHGFAWVLLRLAEDTPAEEITHTAYYGPVRGPEMALAAARQLSRDWACGSGHQEA